MLNVNDTLFTQKTWTIAWYLRGCPLRKLEYHYSPATEVPSPQWPAYNRPSLKNLPEESAALRKYETM